jgi:hypothetical protein
MKSNLIPTIILFLIITGLASQPVNAQNPNPKGKTDTNSVYKVTRLKKPMKIDADWNKREWKKVKSVDIINYMGAVPKFHPRSQAKLMYDDKNIYVIFRTEDQYMRSTVEAVNGGVSRDACVEFFFSPEPENPHRYFHLEANSIGTPFMAYDSVRRRDIKFKADEMKLIEIKSSYPKKIDPEMTEPLTWTLECRMPIELFKQYAPEMTIPKRGATWRANFYKTANASSNPHYLTWSYVDLPRPDFHQPKFFGIIQFK